MVDVYCVIKSNLGELIGWFNFMSFFFVLVDSSFLFETPCLESWLDKNDSSAGAFTQENYNVDCNYGPC